MTSPATAELRPFTPEVEIARAPENFFETDEEVHAAMPPFEHSSELDPSNAETESKVSTEFPYIVLESGIYAQDENGEPLLHMPLILDTDQAAIFNEVIALLEPATVETKLDPSFGFGDDEHEAWSVQTYVPKGYDAHGNQLMTIVATMELRLIELLEEPEVEDGDSGITDTAELAEAVKNHKSNDEAQPDDGGDGENVYVTATEAAETESLEANEPKYSVDFEDDADIDATKMDTLVDDPEEVAEEVDTAVASSIGSSDTVSLPEKESFIVEEITTEEAPMAKKSEEHIAEAAIEDTDDSLVTENEVIIDTLVVEMAEEEIAEISSETTLEEVAPTISSANTDMEVVTHQKVEEKTVESVAIEPETIAEQPKKEAMPVREIPKANIATEKPTAEVLPPVPVSTKIEEKTVFVQLRQKLVAKERDIATPIVDVVEAPKRTIVEQTVQTRELPAKKPHGITEVKEEIYLQPQETIIKKPTADEFRKVQKTTKIHRAELTTGNNNAASSETITYSYTYPPQREIIHPPERDQKQQQTTTSRSFDHLANPTTIRQIAYSFADNTTPDDDLVLTFNTAPRKPNLSRAQLQAARA